MATTAPKAPKKKPAQSTNGASRKSSATCNPALIKPLAARLKKAQLPGEDPLRKKQLDSAASFLLGAACKRKGNASAVAIETSADDTQGRRTRIGLINNDMPFLVDSVAALIAENGLTITTMLHPIVAVRRDGDGLLIDLPSGKAATGESRESMIYIETERADAKTRRALSIGLREVLGDVHAAVSDWPKMQAAMADDAQRVSDPEGAALLRWLNGGMLTQLGHVTHLRNGADQGQMGICRKSAQEIMSQLSYQRAFEWFDSQKGANTGRAPLVIKANRVSNVHRRVPLDLFIIPVIENGRVEALSVHAGVWTSAALAAPSENVPRIRAQIRTLMEHFGFDPKGHAGKGLIHALTALPHDMIMGFVDEDTARVTTTMMALVDRPKPRLALVESPLSRHLIAFVWLPRDMVATETRKRIMAMLEERSGAKILDWSMAVEGGLLATLRFVLDIRENATIPDETELETRLQDMLRGWGEAVENELAEHEDAGRAAALAGRYAEAFPQAYRDRYGAAEAAADIRRLRALPAANALGHSRDARIYRHADDGNGRLRLKIYQQRGSLALSDAVPALENFGFSVDAEIPTLLDKGELGAIHDFQLCIPAGSNADDILERSDAIENAIGAVLNGAAEDDCFNRLIVSTGLAAVEANLVRAIYRYLRQTGSSFTIYTVVDALALAAPVTRGLIALFDARHNPKFKGNRTDAEADAEQAIRSGLAKVQAINDDRLLRNYLDVIRAVLRTNFFAPGGREALAFKIESAAVPTLPKPVPWREIFVYSQRVEGIHLRSGPVARGGLRWSDRRDDFRTEILGLMKAQRVKNAVIVPAGAKGGFYPKQLPNPATDREGWAAEGQASYEIFIRALLSVTDNLVNDKVNHPKGVVIRDADDPYLVVAADKGTARFSDVANGIAEAHGFWLDDAFASGGSNGYDHKAMGITAKGAWVSVQRHFREMGVDVQTESVRVVGCGDMSGDVFGNGMLLSKAIKLIAAFDHRHIFFDPDPDPAKSWKERQRLYDLPRSSWEDYNSKLISKGGGVFSRASKSIKLTAAMRKILDTDLTEADPDALISMILKSPVDLVWFGGIGTYIKAVREPNIDVGDPANDALRVDAAEMRAKVIGEGANLGVTQAGRIQFALNGGRINTDFIDNSAGVDCSDNEVNIKIALAAARRGGKLSDSKRNKLLQEMTDEVAALVLENNRLQALALSVAENGGAKSMLSHMRLIDQLEESDALDRRTEGIADNETLSRRAGEGLGLTRPELSVLLSTAKLVMQDAIEASDLPDDPALADMLIGSFPSHMQATFKKQILNHRLRRELIATKLANLVVNRLGLIQPFELAEEEGVGLAEVAAAFVAAEQLFSIADLWAMLDTADMSEKARLVLLGRLANAMRSHMADILRAGVGSSPSDLLKTLGKPVRKLARETNELLSIEAREQSGRMRAALAETGAPTKAASQVAHLFDLDGSIGIAKLAVDSKIDASQITRAFGALGSALGLDWAQGTAARMDPSDPWERLLVAGLARDFQQMRLEFLSRIAGRKAGKGMMIEAVDVWEVQHDDAIRQFRAMIARAQAASPVAPAMLAQIASQARNLLAR